MLSCNSHKRISPSTNFVVKILQNQLGVALDALTISPFLVIDDKLVEVFNRKEVCEIVKDSVLSS